jgi:hypothetical protein
MTSDVEEIALSETLTEALQSIANLENGEVGTLKIASGATKGTLTIAKGRIVAASITDGNVSGLEALKRLLQLKDGAFRFIIDNAALSTPEFQISVQKLLLNSLDLEKCGGSNDALELGALLKAANYENVNSAIASGHGSPETMEIPQGVYEEFMELIKNEARPNAESPNTDVVPVAATASTSAVELNDETLTQQISEDVIASFASTGEMKSLNADACQNAVPEAITVKVPASETASVPAIEVESVPVGEAESVTAADAPQSRSEQTISQSMPKITSTTVKRSTYGNSADKGGSGGNGGTNSVAEEDAEAVHLPDLSSWVASPDAKAASMENRLTEVEPGSETLNEPPAPDEPVYVNIANAVQLAEIKEKHSVEMIKPSAMDDAFQEVDPPQSARGLNSSSKLNAATRPPAGQPSSADLDAIGAPGSTKASSVRSEPPQAMKSVPKPNVQDVNGPGVVSTSSKPTISQKLDLDSIPTPGAAQKSRPEDQSDNRDPQTTSSRHRMVEPVNEPSIAQKVTGIFSGRKSDSFDDSNSRSIGFMLGIVVLVALCLAFVYVPATMKANAERADSPEMAKQQVQTIVNAGVSRAVPFPAE